ncbi:MAG TPA: helix-hairpin-helix domain-containing protein [Saprospiraceae bacterium]|nr:helix-hairpin-helix domain-containing protein [Saprospiraceae bacterium]
MRRPTFIEQNAGSILQRFLLAGFFCLIFHALSAQTDDPVTAELLENFFRDNETASESDAQQFLENLETWRNRPLDLNTISREDLVAMHLLNSLQVENFLSYRAQMGPFLNEFELQAVPGWELSDIRRMLNYTKVRNGLDQRNTQLWEGIYKGDNELLLRVGSIRSGFYPADAEGDPYNRGIRYRHTYDNRLRFGFTAESDAGEAIFRGSNRNGFDFYSAHLFVQNLNATVKTVALGDYSARFGQGVLLQTGFWPGKSAETVSVTRGGRKINAYGAFGEAFFFRGAATTLAFGKHVEITALYSDRRRDGNIVAPDTIDQEFQEIEFSSLQTSGLHRTRSEIQDEKALREQVGGLSSEFKWKNGQVTANGLYITYDKPWTPQPAPYRKYIFQGQSLAAASVDYNWRYRNWLLFGETARSDNGGMAAVNGLLVSPDQHITLTAMHRALGKDYQSIYGSPFAEVSRASNEQGMYLGADIRYIRRWQINLYADVWKHPWLRYGVSSPSRGREFLARVIWTKSKTFSAYALWQAEVKERDSDVEGINGLLENRRDRFRLHASYKVGAGVELRSRIEWTIFSVQNGTTTNGFIAYQEAAIKPLSFPVTATARYAVFDTDGFDTRVYAFETDLFSAVSIPALSGRGSRAYLNLSWRVNKWLRLEGRVEQTNQLRAVTSTGDTGREVFWKFQVRMRW